MPESTYAASRHTGTVADQSLNEEMMEDKLRWYKEAKLGLFIHWGPYSQAGVEASWPIMVPGMSALSGGSVIAQDKYEALAATFYPVEFDAHRWVKAAKNAGMRYLVITAKHHDGYCMFDAPGTEYKITNSPFGRDVIAELSAACATAGMRFGIYYSPPDMHHPGYRDTSKPAKKNWYGEPKRAAWAEYLDYMERHLRHLLTAYGDVDILWLDGLFEQDKYQPARFHRIIRDLQPKILINDRLGSMGDFVTPEQGIPDAVPVRRTGEKKEISAKAFSRIMKVLNLPGVRQYVSKKLGVLSENPRPLTRFPTEPFPREDRFQPWETCMTMNRTWAYSEDPLWKPPELLLRLMAKVVARGGNFLLNVGPDSLGRFPLQAMERLEEIGRWISTNGEAIYGTSYGPPAGENAVSTRKNGAAYLIALGKSDTGELTIPAELGAVGRASALGTGVVTEINQSGDGPRLTLPNDFEAKVPLVIKLEV